MGMTLTIGDVTQRTGIAQTALRYYEQVGLIPAPQRVGGQRRYQESVLMRLEVIRLCKTAGFSLSEIGLLLEDATPGRPVARELAQAKLAEIDAQLESLARARAIIEWGMRCTCPSIELCTCGIHRDLPA
ncbi:MULTISPECIES: MerR family transcriptional regulator [unclassified Mycolicibacterium]|uniref:MerR family transcriptional regulator n=1 Tax=unclassified Mycolicibacterium TaxID=2636767 RepID=UPI0012DD3B58|nr:MULTISPECIES: MerR family transcriptional regulator [unclassified Mycolicibacterium]MUL84576.1 MerR family transcriptional regulator [Mycolicibacterium sp. CBMA 329]MUL88351.1 MerR family transcriptional regulator [Mycolicibacterium sp. CBMA 331]MUL99200.1 MerR family transcriptional regulator [Mycolicibacterium sp. CBMA 334]MUM25039.1 MerR family transcriptional regulator [Mycolicibacterium sp. CBMA 295]MUM39998.1 MerR family transcriptional regulator [Mycolicibacterium sp. CBMA 247]